METNGNGSVRLVDFVNGCKRPKRGVDVGGALVIPDAGSYPRLVEFFTVVPTSRKGVKGGRAGFYVQNGRLTCALSLPVASAVAFTTLDALDEAWATIELSLGNGSLEWIEDAPKGR